ncbi:MAG: hypothetical protein L3K52_16660 [Candidatus Thiothrix sulfatifontis]|nr:MAG: hypothetical protein L3K52_16660 [Candidatus Thiothrix sulfatifontis]
MNTCEPDPERVLIVVETAHCSPERAELTIQALDKHDLAQQAHRTTPTTTDSSGYASFDELLSPGAAALVAAGYGGNEAAFILQTLFNGLAVEHGGKRLYLPKPERLLRKFETVQFFNANR